MQEGTLKQDTEGVFRKKMYRIECCSPIKQMILKFLPQYQYSKGTGYLFVTKLLDLSLLRVLHSCVTSDECVSPSSQVHMQLTCYVNTTLK